MKTPRVTGTGVVVVNRVTLHRTQRLRHAGVPPTLSIVSSVAVYFDPPDPYRFAVLISHSAHVAALRCEGHRVTVTFSPSRTDAPFCRALRAQVVCADPGEHVLDALAALGG